MRILTLLGNPLLRSLHWPIYSQIYPVILGNMRFSHRSIKSFEPHVDMYGVFNSSILLMNSSITSIQSPYSISN